MTEFAADRLLLFGATGDLSRRKLLPSLCALDADGLLPENLAIIGTARSDMSDAEFRDMARAALEEFLPAERRGGMAGFLNRLSYQGLDASTVDGFDALAAKVAASGDTDGGLAIFLSTAPSLFGPTIAGLEHAGLTGERVRMCLEKPLGTDLATSAEINDAVAEAFSEDRIFRIDHYLGKETVQNLLALRFANILFEPIWNSNVIEHVQITVAETVGLEGRVAFYDDAGVRDEKVKVLRALRPVDASETVTGQYRAGAIEGQSVPGYDEELGKPSTTETFAAIKAHVDNWRWKGVPFYLRTGKRLPERVTEILVQFRAVPHSIFEGSGAGLQPNSLLIGIQPDEDITLSLMAKVPGLDEDGVRLREVPLQIKMPDAFVGSHRRIAYERLLLDLIKGDQTLFVRRDEVEAQWEWVDAIRAEWEAHGITPKTYNSGNWGPTAAIALTERDGVSWHE